MDLNDILPQLPEDGMLDPASPRMAGEGEDRTGPSTIAPDVQRDVRIEEIDKSIEEIEKSLGKLRKMLAWWKAFKKIYLLPGAASGTAFGMEAEGKAGALEYRLVAGGGCHDSSCHIFLIISEYMDIVGSAWSDSEKTSTLTPLLRQEKDGKLLECFRGPGQWVVHDDTATFRGSPDWESVMRKLEQLHQLLDPAQNAAQMAGSATDGWMCAEDHVRAILKGMAGVKTKERDESPNCFKLFRQVEGRPKQMREPFQCMFCCLNKFPSICEDGTTSFDIDVSKNLGKPFAFSNPVCMRYITLTMTASEKEACADHNGCLMHRLFKTVIGGVNSLFQEDLKSLCSEVKDKTKMPKIERELKMLEDAHLDSLKRLRGAELDVASFFNAAAVPGVSFQDGKSSAGGVIKLLNVLQKLSPEILKHIDRHLPAEAADMLRKMEAILNETEVSAEAGAAGSASSNTRSAKGVRPSVRSGGGSVQRQDEEENRVLKVLEDLHAWPMQVVEEVEVSQVVEEVEVSQLMGALSLSANARAGDESVVFPLVVVRVLQDGERLAATQVGSDFRLYEVDEGKIIKVVLVNLSQRDVDMWPVYVGEKEEGEKFGSVTFDQIRIAPGGRKDVPEPEFPGLRKSLGEREEAWVLKDESGTSLLKLRFVLKET